MSERQTKAGNQERYEVLENFCFHVYAQKSLIISEIGNVYFLHNPPHHPLL